MTPAELARRNAIPLELKKDGLSQRQSGDWVLRFVVQASDMDERLMKAAMGTRFQAALVEVNDDESPKEVMPNPPIQSAKQLDKRPQPEPHSAGAKWRDLQPAQQAGIRCQDPIFCAFLNEEYTSTFHRYFKDAAGTVRFICGINSRAELGTKQAARIIWRQLDEKFSAWKAREHA